MLNIINKYEKEKLLYEMQELDGILNFTLELIILAACSVKKTKSHPQQLTNSCF